MFCSYKDPERVQNYLVVLSTAIQKDVPSLPTHEIKPSGSHPNAASELDALAPGYLQIKLVKFRLSKPSHNRDRGYC